MELQNQLKIQFFDSEKSCGKLTKKNLETYLSADSELELLKKVVMDPFEEAVKEFVGFNNGKLPEKKKDMEVKVGRYKFNVEVKPSTSASYVGVYEDVHQYTEGLIQGKELGKKREGVRTIDQEPHALLDDIIDVLNESIENNTSSTVSKKIKPVKQEANPTENFFEVKLDANYKDLNDANARTYLECKTQSERIKKHITAPFVKAVKAEIGFTKANIPAEVTYTKMPLGNALIYAVSSKADNISYAGIVDDIIKMVEAPVTRTVEGKKYVHLENLKQKLEGFKSAHTEPSLRQSISYLRLPKSDAYVIE